MDCWEFLLDRCVERSAHPNPTTKKPKLSSHLITSPSEIGAYREGTDPMLGTSLWEWATRGLAPLREASMWT
jgi:hypothetical protein